MKIINRLFFMVALLVGCAAAGMERPENGTWGDRYDRVKQPPFVSNYDSANPDPFIEGWVDTIHELQRGPIRTDMRLDIRGNAVHLLTKFRAYLSLSNHIPPDKINSLSNNVQAAILFLKNTRNVERPSGAPVVLQLGSTQNLRGTAQMNSNVNGDSTQTILPHLAAIDAEIGDNHPATWWKQVYKGTLLDEPVSNPTSNPHNPDPSPKTEDPITHSQPTPSNTKQSPISSNVAVTSSPPNGTTPPKPQPASNQKAGTIGKPTRDQFINTDGSLKAQEYIEAWNAYKNDGNNVTGDKELAVKFRTKQMFRALAWEVDTDLLVEKCSDSTEEQINAILYFKNFNSSPDSNFQQHMDVLMDVREGIEKDVFYFQLTWVDILTDAPNNMLPNIYDYKLTKDTYNYDTFITALYAEVEKKVSLLKNFNWDDDNHRRTKISIIEALERVTHELDKTELKEKLKGKTVVAQRINSLLTTLHPVDDDLSDDTHTIESMPGEKLTPLFKATKALLAIPKEELIAFIKTPSKSKSASDSSSDNTQKSLIFGLSTKKAVFVALGLATAAAVAGGIYYAMSTGKDSDAQLEENG